MRRSNNGLQCSEDWETEEVLQSLKYDRVADVAAVTQRRTAEDPMFR